LVDDWFGAFRTHDISKLKLAHGTLIGLTFMILASCRAADSADSGWPSLQGNIDSRQLPTPSVLSGPVQIDPYGSRLSPAQFYEELTSLSELRTGKLLSGVVMHQYPEVTVGGHFFGTGTYVYYLPDENVFYLFGDDYMDHIDGVIGPFTGDPRVLLPEYITEP
jgi:hypothetical protein